jgi:hypothetical protein
VRETGQFAARTAEEVADVGREAVDGVDQVRRKVPPRQRAVDRDRRDP